MSQSNDSPTPCADKGGHGEANISLCDTLRSRARGQKKRNLATVTIVDAPTGKRKRGKKKRNSWEWKVMQPFALPIGKCSVRCSVEFNVFRSEGGKGCSRTIALAVVVCFTRWQFWTSESSGIASSETSRSILAGHQLLHQLQRLCQPLRSFRAGDFSPNFAADIFSDGAKTPSPIGYSWT